MCNRKICVMGSVIKEIVNPAVGSGDRQQLFYCQPTWLIGTPESTALRISITNSQLSNVTVIVIVNRKLFIEPILHLLHLSFVCLKCTAKENVCYQYCVRKDPAGTIQWRQSFRGWRALRVTIFPFHDTTRTLKWNTSSYIFYLVISSDSIKWKGF